VAQIDVGRHPGVAVVAGDVVEENGDVPVAAIWLPCAYRLAFVIALGADHDWPPSVVRENIGCPRYENAWLSLANAMFSPGRLPWIHVT
jgi:hypothetical protein